MPKDLNAVIPSMDDGNTAYVAVEISDKSWVVGIGLAADPGKVGVHTLTPADTDGLVERIEKVRARTGGSPRVLLTYEAGYEGFWLARWFGEKAPWVDVLVCDPASLEVVRKAKRAKTDKIDARRMVRALRAWDRGEEEALSVVRIPTVEEEDAKRLLRHRERLVRERIQLGNTIKGLLKLRGIRNLEPRHPAFLADLAEVHTAYGAPLPPVLRDEIEVTHERLVVVMAQLNTIEEKKAALIEEAAAMLDQAASYHQGQQAGTENEQTGPATRAPAVPGAAALLVKLKGIGANDALLLQHEVLYRDFRNRRELASWAGLTRQPRGRAAGSRTTRASARRDTRWSASIWCKWLGAGCGISPTARSRDGSISTVRIGVTSLCASGPSSLWRASFLLRCGGTPEPAWCRRARCSARRDAGQGQRLKQNEIIPDPTRLDGVAEEPEDV